MINNYLWRNNYKWKCYLLNKLKLLEKDINNKNYKIANFVK